MPKVPERKLSLGEKLNLERRTQRTHFYQHIKRKPNKKPKKQRADYQWSKPERLVVQDLINQFRED